MKLSGKIVSALTAAVMSITATPIVSAFAAVGDKLSVGNGTNQHKGVSDGYSYEVWLDNTGGSGSMTLGRGATFKAEWNASVYSGNFLARRGLDFGSEKKATDYDFLALEYKADYRQTSSNNGNSRLCVYGWFENEGAEGNVPLVEYYIIEDWVDWCPSSSDSKTVIIDGAQYKIFQLDHTGPTIHGGNETFKQYFSVRQSKRTSGYITVSDHFKAWEEQGWGIGNLYEVALNAEGWQSNGVADVTMLDLYTEKWGPVTPPTEPSSDDPVEPDENGYYFNSTFESGTDDWDGRGDASVKSSSSMAYSGSKSLYVSGRTDEWNGAICSLGSEFKAGEEYSFSVNAAYDKGDASRTFKLTLEYNDGSDTKWDEIATGTTVPGEWVQLANTNYKFPKGSDYKLIVETNDGTLEDFYIDEAVGAAAGTKIDGAGQPDIPEPPVVLKPGEFYAGDVTCDAKVDVYDIVALRQGVISGEFASKNARYAADVNADDEVGAADLVLLSNYVLGKDVELKKAEIPKAQMRTISEYTPIVEKNVVEAEPDSSRQNKNGVDYGKLEQKSYFSNFCGRTKKYNVLLPAGYTTSKEYPVLYVMHGYYENQDRMILTGNNTMYTKQIIGNAIAEGAAKEMIVVFPYIYSSKTQDDVSGMDDANNQAYDNFDTVLTTELMPLIEKEYSVATGRENTAITGFSMGGRESLNIGMKHPDLFGYVGAICPAPGASGAWKFASEEESPSLIFITAGGNDDVVYTTPNGYHENFTKNGVPHIWHYYKNGYHGDNSIHAHLYNFVRAVFQA